MLFLTYNHSFQILSILYIICTKKSIHFKCMLTSRHFFVFQYYSHSTFRMLSHFSHVADTLFSVRILSVLSVKSDVFKIFSIRIVSEGSSLYDIFRHYIHQCQSGIDIISLNTDLSIEISPCAALIVASMIISGSHLLKSMSKPAFLIRSVINNLSVRPFPSRNG